MFYHFLLIQNENGTLHYEHQIYNTLLKKKKTKQKKSKKTKKTNKYYVRSLYRKAYSQNRLELNLFPLLFLVKISVILTNMDVTVEKLCVTQGVRMQIY